MSSKACGGGVAVAEVEEGEAGEGNIAQDGDVAGETGSSGFGCELRN